MKDLILSTHRTAIAVELWNLLRAAGFFERARLRFRSDRQIFASSTPAPRGRWNLFGTRVWRGFRQKASRRSRALIKKYLRTNFGFLEYVSPKRSPETRQPAWVITAKGQKRSTALIDGSIDSVNNFRIRINCLIRFWLIKTVFMCCLFIISVVLRLLFARLHRWRCTTTGTKPKSIGKLASFATRENSLINSTVFSTLIDVAIPFLLHMENFSFIELDRLCNSLETKNFFN